MVDLGEKGKSVLRPWKLLEVFLIIKKYRWTSEDLSV